MTKRERQYGFLLIFLLGHVISDFISGDTEEGVVVKSRQKRSLICMFGLTSVLKETVRASLEDVQQYDPLDLGDAEDCDLEDGTLRGLSTLRTLSDLDVHCTDESIIVFATTLGMRGAEIKYNWKRTFLFTLYGTIWLKAKEVNFNLEVHMNTTGGLSFKVPVSLLTKLEDFEFGFTGLGPLNPMVRGSVHLMYNIWTGRVTQTIETLVQKGLEKKLDEISHTIDFLLNF